jgi:branched-chain amino acid aminotransferase
VRSYATPNGPRLFALGAHLERLRRGAERLGLSTDLEALGWACEEIVFRNGYDDAHVARAALPGPAPGRSHAAAVARPWGGRGKRRFPRAPPHSAFAPPSPSSQRAARTDHPPLKRTGPSPQRIFAQRDAAAAGFDEAIFVDPEGRVIDAAGGRTSAR